MRNEPNQASSDAPQVKRKPPLRFRHRTLIPVTTKKAQGVYWVALSLLTWRLKTKPASSASGMSSIDPCTARYRASCVSPFTSKDVNITKKMRKERDERTLSIRPLRELVTVFNPKVYHNGGGPGRKRPWRRPSVGHIRQDPETKKSDAV